MVTSAGNELPLGESPNEANLLDLATLLLRRWRVVLALPFAVSVVVAALSLAVPRRYTASTAFTSEVSSPSFLPSNLAGLAGQFGIQLGTEASQSAQFYASVIRSRDIINQVLQAHYPDPTSARFPADSLPLLGILEVEGDSLADSLHNGREEMERLVSVSVDRITNIVTVSVDSRYPTLASDIANDLVGFLNEFNAKTRQSQARERRRFVEERVSGAEEELLRIEERIKQFYQQNRTWQQSPQLTFEHERLQRQLQIRQEVALTLKREYETARISEVNDTPVITVIYAATPPQEKSWPKRTLLTLLAFLLAMMAGILIALLGEFIRRHPAQYQRLRRSLAESMTEVRRALIIRPRSSANT